MADAPSASSAPIAGAVDSAGDAGASGSGGGSGGSGKPGSGSWQPVWQLVAASQLLAAAVFGGFSSTTPVEESLAHEEGDAADARRDIRPFPFF